MDFDHCFALNFGFGSSLEIPTFSMPAFSFHVDQNKTEEMLLNREMLTSASEECLLVFVGEQYLEKIDDITKMVKKLSREVGTRPTALFVNTRQKNKVISPDILFYPLVNLKVKYLFCFEFGFFQVVFDEEKMKYKIFGTAFWLQCPGQKNGRNMVLFDSLEKQTDFIDICPPSAEPINFAYHTTSISRVVVN